MGKEKNFAGRKWLLTINNPQKHGYTREEILIRMELLNPSYFCMCEEVGENGTPHIHIYIFREPSIRFGQLKNLFPEAHIDRCVGSHQDNRDYLRKEGSYKDSEKAATNLIDTFYESGPLPEEGRKQSATEKQSVLIEMIEQGYSDADIVKRYPVFMYRINQIKVLRETLLSEKYRKEFRDVHVTFVTGPTGTGKTFAIQEEHGFENICRVTDYPDSGVKFDNYNFQDVLVFEEFASQIRITDMLNILDSYPLELPARYTNHTAAFTKVYITSNLALYDLYPNVQHDSLRTWQAFLRRIDKVRVYTGYREFVEKDVLDMLIKRDRDVVLAARNKGKPIDDTEQNERENQLELSALLEKFEPIPEDELTPF